MKSISGKLLCKIVEERGWVLKRITASHHIYQKSEFRGNRERATGNRKNSCLKT